MYERLVKPFVEAYLFPEPTDGFGLVGLRLQRPESPEAASGVGNHRGHGQGEFLMTSQEQSEAFLPRDILQVLVPIDIDDQSIQPANVPFGALVHR